ncbi:MAG TPA: hypothetical protein HPP66_04710 [Planctomycetes bacterium]|nr:hypothetical protein [Planctomycetota bacterium]
MNYEPRTTSYKLCKPPKLPKIHSLPSHLSFPRRRESITTYAIRYTSIEDPTLAHFRHFSSLFTNFPSTFVVSALQIAHFMQNKPNFQKAQMNVNMVLTVDYEKKTLGERGKNKPNSNPIKPNSLP